MMLFASTIVVERGLKLGVLEIEKIRVAEVQRGKTENLSVYKDLTEEDEGFKKRF